MSEPFTHVPMTREQIAGERVTAQASVVRTQMRQYKFLRAALVLQGLLIALAIMLWGTSDAEGINLFPFFPILVIAITLVVFGEVSPLTGVGVGCVGLSILIIVQLASLDNSTSAALLIAFVSAILYGGVIEGFNSRYDNEIDAFKYQIETFADLDASKGDQCVKYLAWCQTNPELRGYQDAIWRMGRMPILLDYLRAEAWMEGEEARQLADQSQEACKRLAAWEVMPPADRSS